MLGFLKTENGNNLISDIQKQVAITSEDISVNNINVKKLKYKLYNCLLKNSMKVTNSSYTV